MIERTRKRRKEEDNHVNVCVCVCVRRGTYCQLHRARKKNKLVKHVDEWSISWRKQSMSQVLIWMRVWSLSSVRLFFYLYFVVRYTMTTNYIRRRKQALHLNMVTCCLSNEEYRRTTERINRILFNRSVYWCLKEFLFFDWTLHNWVSFDLYTIDFNTNDRCSLWQSFDRSPMKYEPWWPTDESSSFDLSINRHLY